MKILPNNIAVLENDTHISKWVEEAGRLDIACNYLRGFKHYVRNGDTVVDAGAMIGDHTLTYSEWVGDTGRIYAFEPYKESYECLSHNLSHKENTEVYNLALGNYIGKASYKYFDPNVGASHLDTNEGSIDVTTLDSFNLQRLSFLKIDVEGFEVRLLQGAKETISRCKPVMLIEINSGALERAGTSSQELRDLISKYGYRTFITDKHLHYGSLQYDVLCLTPEMR